MKLDESLRNSKIPKEEKIVLGKSLSDWS